MVSGCLTTNCFHLIILYRTKKATCEKPKTEKKKKGRKTRWSTETLDDFVDIVTNDEYYKRKLIFTNTKNQQNGLIYEKILKELKDRCSARDEDIDFTAAQLRTKFKKCVSDCKFAALTIKTGSGIKRFQEDKGFGAWFNKLFPLVQTRDSCKAVEPSATTSTIAGSNTENDSHEEENSEKPFVPIKSTKKKSSNKDTIAEVIGLIKETISNDPAKEMISFMREELQKSMEHEAKLVDKFLSATHHPPQQHASGPTPQTYWQVHGNEYQQVANHVTGQGCGRSFQSYQPWQGESSMFFSPSPLTTRPSSSCSSSSLISSASQSHEEHLQLEEKTYHKL
jgi:translation initiation factor 1 (eIF-1/SUI1)